VGKVARKGQPKAGGSEYLELHGAFSIALRAPGAALLSKVWFPCWARERMNCFRVGVAGRNRPAGEGGEGRALCGRSQGGLLPAKDHFSHTDLVHCRLNLSHDSRLIDE
jgi:hypothetical protein